MHTFDPDPQWYLDNVMRFAEPGTNRVWRPGPAERWREWWAAQADDPTGPPELRWAAQQGFVLTTSQLRRLDISRQRTRTLVGHRRWEAPARGVVAPIDVRADDRYLVARRRHALAAAAATLTHPDHVVSGRSAGVLHGVPVFALPSVPELTDRAGTEPNGLGRRPRAHLHGASLTVTDVQRWFGVPVTSLARTLVDLARHDRWDGIIAADAALAESLVTRSDMLTALDQARGWPGVRQARAVVEFADGRAESPLESMTRLVLVDQGFPVPELQVPLGPYRVDLLFRERRLVVEADGLDKYTAAELRREKQREMRLRAMGFHVERVLWEDIVRYSPETHARLTAAFRLPA